MIRALRCLTLRGKALLAFGTGIAAGAALSGQRDLLRLAVILVVLPLAAAVVVARVRLRLECQRRLLPQRLAVGSTGVVELAVTNVDRRPTGTFLLTDHVPPELGTSVRRTIERAEPGGVRTTSYPVEARRRGRFEVGPLRVTCVDPFGLVRLTRSFRATDPVLVVPSVVHFPDAGLRADHRGHGDGQAATIATRGQDDVIPRDYREGDDLRRIHWRATARAGSLMVRREELPWSNQAAVVVDLRARAHGGEGPEASVEVAISAAASAAVHLLRHGWQVRLVSTDGSTLVASAHGADGEAQVLEALAVVRTTSVLNIAPGVTRGDLVIAVVAADARVSESLSGRAARGPGQLGLALVVDTAAWWGEGARPAIDVAADLAISGWRASVIGPRPGDLENAWRAVTAETAGAFR